jgi:predicted NBD/HSP70 family sugar kinase
MPGWDGFPVADWLEEHFACPVLVDNDVNVMALGEREHYYPHEKQFMFVKVGTGIGAGLIVDGRLHRGAQGSAGDIGHIYLPGHDEVVCECGNTGCLEAVAGGRALARRLRAQGVDAAGSRDVVAQVIAGNTDAVLAVREAGRELGLVLAGLVNAINPALIVLGGAIAAAGDHLLAGVREVIYRRSPPLATRNLRIVASAAGGRAGVIGAAVMITDEILSNPEVGVPEYAGAARGIRQASAS